MATYLGGQNTNNIFGSGDYKSVATLQDRDNLSIETLSVGMIVYVVATSQEYRLISSSPVRWQVVSSGAIDDNAISTSTVWSSEKTNSELATLEEKTIGGAPEDLNTLGKIALSINNDKNFYKSITRFVDDKIRSLAIESLRDSIDTLTTISNNSVSLLAVESLVRQRVEGSEAILRSELQSSIDSINSSIQSVKSQIFNTQNTLVTPTSAEAIARSIFKSMITSTNQEIGDILSRVEEETVARTSQYMAEAAQRSKLAVKVANNTATLETESAVRAIITGEEWSANKTGGYEPGAVVLKDNKLYQNVTSIYLTGSIIPGLASTATQWKEVTKSIYAQWTVKTDVNGHIAGIGLMNDGATSEFVVQADKFQIVGTGSNPKTPFSIDTTTEPSQIALNGDVRIDGTLTWNQVIGPEKPEDGATRNVFVGTWSYLYGYYRVGDSVLYNGETFTCTKAHESEANKNPKNTAYWQQMTIKGDDAKNITLLADSQIFQVKKNNTVNPYRITFIALLSGALVGDPIFITENGEATLTDGEAPNSKILLANNMLSDIVTIKATVSDGTMEISDWITIAKIREGSDAINMILSNDSHNFPTDVNNNVISYNGSGTEIRVYEGFNELVFDYQGYAPGTWRLTATPSNITSGLITKDGNRAILESASVMTDTTASIVLTATGRTLNDTEFTVSKTQSLSKTKSGVSYDVRIESSNGTVFKIGQEKTTVLKARVFKNGVEITDELSDAQFRWRRVSYVSNPGGDEEWNYLYRIGYKQIEITINSVDSIATFFCDILEEQR